MDKKDKEIIKLKKSIVALENENKELKEENEYLTSELYTYLKIQDILGEYLIHLNPPKIEFQTAVKQAKAIFEVSLQDIVCVIAEGRNKKIYCKSVQKSIDGIKYEKNYLPFTGTLKDCCNVFDKKSIQLCIVSKNAAVNALYYDIDKDKLKLSNNVEKPNNSCDNIPISTKLKEVFVSKKRDLNQIISWIEKLSHYK